MPALRRAARNASVFLDDSVEMVGYGVGGALDSFSQELAPLDGVLFGDVEILDDLTGCLAADLDLREVIGGIWGGRELRALGPVQ